MTNKKNKKNLNKKKLNRINYNNKLIIKKISNIFDQLKENPNNKDAISKLYELKNLKNK